MSLNIDFTSQKEAETELLRTAERLQALLNIESGILRAESPQAVADVALEHLERIIPTIASAVTLFQSSYTKAVMLTGRNFTVTPGRIYPADADQVAVRKRGEAMIIGDIAALPVKSTGMQLVEQLGGQSLLSVPMLAQGELIGMMSLVSAKQNAFSKADIQIAGQVANSVAIAIHNAELLDKEKKARREAETLREVATGLTGSLDHDELLSLILTQLKRVLHYDSATILLYQSGSLTPVAQQGIEVPRKEIIDQLSQLPPNVMRLSIDHRPQIIADTRDDPEWIVYPGTEFIRSWLGVPLLVKEAFIGLLMLDYSEPDFYDDQDAAIALTFANHAAVAIENANLYHEVQQYATDLEKLVSDRTHELGALYEITAVSSQHLDLQQTLDRMISITSDVLQCRTVAVQLLDESGTIIRLVAYKNLSAPMVEYIKEMPIKHLIMQEILETEEAKIYIRPPSDPRLADAPIPGAVSYSVGAPIRSKGKVLGILGIGIDRPEPPSREDIALITSIADHIGVAVENARLRQQSEQLAVMDERERLARDLHDSATQSLFTLTLFAAAAREHLSSGQLELVHRQLIELEETAVQTHKEMRLLLYELRPTALQEEGLEGALRQRMKMVEFRSGIRGHISTNLDTKLPYSVEEVFFQVANEALNNTLKHSGADKVMIEIRSDGSFFNMKITDNGQGFTEDDASFSAGMGMENMHSRLQEMGGTLHFESRPDSGTTVVAQIPFDPEKSSSDA